MSPEMKAEWKAARKVKPVVDNGTMDEETKKRLEYEVRQANQVLNDPKFLLYKGIGLDGDIFERS